MDIPIVRSARLTLCEMATMLNLIEERLLDGSYYGNKEQYKKRLTRIADKLPYLTKPTPRRKV